MKCMKEIYLESSTFWIYDCFVSRHMCGFAEIDFQIASSMIDSKHKIK
jgi:hypothetical protein